MVYMATDDKPGDKQERGDKPAAKGAKKEKAPAVEEAVC